MLKNLLFLIMISISFLNASEKPKLNFYCGITMAKPMQVIANILEKKHNCKINIIQGGSQDLYNTLKTKKDADLYLPGSDSYVKNNLKDGLLLENAYLGFNQASIFVQKGNPKNIKNLNSSHKCNI